MDAIRRTSTLRRVATTASLAALLLIPGHADAKGKHKPKVKPPVITSVRPMSAQVGDTLVVKGRNFRTGKGRNSVGFKRVGAAVVFVRSDLSTTRTMTVKLGAKLETVLKGGTARFRLRVLAGRFGKRFTSLTRSPVIRSKAVGAPVAPGDDCDLDGLINADDLDDDNDLLPDEREAQINSKLSGAEGLKLDICNADSDADGISDGFEYKSAKDLNNNALPFPGSKPYANPLDGTDAEKDFDGDGLQMFQEYHLWRFTVDKQNAEETLDPLTYSEGLKYSMNLAASNYSKLSNPLTRNQPQPRCDDVDNASKATDGFLDWAERCGHKRVTLRDYTSWDFRVRALFTGDQSYDIRDVNRSSPGGDPSASEALVFDSNGDGRLSDDERDEDADGLSNYMEATGPISQAGWWDACYKDANEKPYPIVYAGTDLADSDSDGDGVRDGADDQDYDDIPNLMELSREAASGEFDGKTGCQKKDPPKPTTPTGPSGPSGPSGPTGPVATATPEPTPTVVHPTAYGRVNPFNPCLPDTQSRTCPTHREIGDGGDYAPFDNSDNWESYN
jgi:hypothetical protein